MFSESFRDLDTLRVWYLCKELWQSFWKKPWAWFPGYGSQAAFSGQITAQPRGWWARKGQSTVGSCTIGAVQSGKQSMGLASDLLVLPEKEKCHRPVREVGNRVS